MMNKENNYLLYFLILITLFSCKLPSDPFNRPKISPTINSNCTGFQNGEMIDATNFISVSTDDYDLLQTYYDDIEYRLYICKKYKKRCK